MALPAPLARTVMTVLLALALALGAAVLTRDQRATGDSGSDDAIALVQSRTDASRGVVTGRLSRHRTHRAVRAVARAVDRWWEPAYLDGAYPRRRFGTAFAVFTARARHGAKRDRDLLTNAAIGERVEQVRAKKRRVRVDLLATRGRARAATAHVRLVFRTFGERSRVVTVRGRVLLVRGERRWRILGYDIAKGSVAVRSR